jgi:hypothetical protein
LSCKSEVQGFQENEQGYISHTVVSLWTFVFLLVCVVKPPLKSYLQGGIQHSITAHLPTVPINTFFVHNEIRKSCADDDLVKYLKVLI